jgi:hypothetical protein
MPCSTRATFAERKATQRILFRTTATTSAPQGRGFPSPGQRPEETGDAMSCFRPNGPAVPRNTARRTVGPSGRRRPKAHSFPQGVALGWENCWAFGPVMPGGLRPVFQWKLCQPVCYGGARDDRWGKGRMTNDEGDGGVTCWRERPCSAKPTGLGGNTMLLSKSAPATP